MAGQETNPTSGKPGNRAFPVLLPQGALQGQPDIPLDRPVTTVGSNENARLHLVSRTVSKGHAIFVNDGPVTYVADLASRTGVLVNAKLVKEAQLKSGDRVQIGKFVFRYRSATLPGTPAPQPPPAAVIVVGWPAMPITTRVVQIGRRDTSDIAFTDDAGVSAAHAVVFQMNGNWYLRDVGSRTGTLVNGKPIHQQGLKFGDRIVIGSSTILFQPSVVTEELEEEPPIAEGLSPIPSHLPADAEEDLDGGSIDLNPVSDPVPLVEEEAIPLAEESAAAPVAETAVEEPIPLEEPAASAALLDEQIIEPVESTVETEPSGAAADVSASDADLPEDFVSEPVEAIEEPRHAEEPVAAEPLGAAKEATEQKERSGSATDTTVSNADLQEDFVSEPVEAIEEPLHAEEPAAAEPLDSVVEITEQTEPSASAADATASNADLPEDFVSEPVGGSEEPVHAEEPAAAPRGSVVETIEQTAPSGAAAGVTASDAGLADDVVAAPAEAIEDPVHTDESAAEPIPVHEDVPPVSEPMEDVTVAGEGDIAFADEAVAPTPASPEAHQPMFGATESPDVVEAVAAAELAEVHEQPAAPQPAAEALVSPTYIAIPQPPVVPPELVAEVDDFVFVPNAETTDSGEIPEVLFWGEEEPTPPTPASDISNVEHPTSLADAGSEIVQRAGSDVEGSDLVEGHPESKPPEDSPAPTVETADSSPVDQAIESSLSETPPHQTVQSAPPPELPAPEAPEQAPAEPEVTESTETEVAATGLHSDPVDEQIEPASAEVESADPFKGELDFLAAETSSATVITSVATESTQTPAATEPPSFENDDLIFQDVIDPAAIEEFEAHATDFIQTPVAPVPGPMPTMAVAVTAAGTLTPAIGDLASVLADARQQLDYEPSAPAETQPFEQEVDEEFAEATVEEPAVAVESHEPLLIESVGSADELPPSEPADWSSLSTVDEVAPDANVVHSDKPTIALTADNEWVEPVEELEPEWIEPEPDDLEMESLAEDSLIGSSGGVAPVEELDELEREEPSGFELESEKPAIIKSMGEKEPAVEPPSSLGSVQLPLEHGDAHVAPSDEHVDTDDLAFLEFSAPPVAPQQVTELTPIDKVELAPAEELLPKPKSARPPLFGFDFDGGSFLGGMPLPLNTPMAPPVKTPAPVSKETAFDAKQTPPSGLSGSLAAKPVVRAVPPVPPPPPVVIPPPVAEAPATPPPPVTETKVVLPPPPAAAPAARRPSGPTVPPRPSKAAAAKPTSTAGLGASAPAAFGQSPAAPTPPRPAPGKPARLRPSPGRATTTNFSVPAPPNGSADIFSQMSSPIGVEVFGGPAVNPEQIVIPDAKKPSTGDASDEAQKPAAQAQIPKKPRSSRLPVLIILLVGLVASSWFLSNRLVPISTQIVGTLKFSGLESLPPDEGHIFNAEQNRRLQTPELRQQATFILQRQNVPAGFIADDEQYTQIVDKQYLTWKSDGSVDFVYHTSDPERGRARVDAILTALKEKDQDLQNIRDRALVTANAAKSNRSTLEAEGRRLARRHVELAARAERRPDSFEMEQAKTDARNLKLKWSDAQVMLQNSRDVLTNLQNQDPNKPVDIDADVQVVKLQKDIAQLEDQARARKPGGVSIATPHGLATDIPIGATTQPDQPSDMMLTELQNRIAVLRKRLDNRRSSLTVLQAMGPTQRQANLQKEKESLNILISKCADDEAQAKAVYETTAAKLANLDDQMKDAIIADASKEEVSEQMKQNDESKRQAVNEENTAEQALANCVTVADLAGEPNPKIGPAEVQADFRRPVFLMSSSIICFVLGILIWGELRRPKLITNVRRPDAAPLVNPLTRIVPWPHPQQLEV